VLRAAAKNQCLPKNGVWRSTQAFAEYKGLMAKKAASPTGTLSEYEETLIIYMDAS
jgi:hypothetical protein